ncbi:doxyhypusine synthase [Thalassiosira pseudonana CCMP1335]|uniref:deoxyhypusine synthase n=1 Tax=Thalassiosira pseudonana TaxID=35128 RepID=B8C502_THAPS|nr:doxyhypusine synthase [Thalassiosira pseudonana CCMP1335]EED91423.1 doxyhypusine synthase [Thalassiosira pseudonana CCMP1335]|eukprot:g14772.t1 g14772   contig90:358381-359670(+)
MTETTKEDDPNTILSYQPLPSNNAVTSNPHIPSVTASAVLGESSSMPDDVPICKGHDFNGDKANETTTSSNDIDSIMTSMLHTGFQATNVAKSITQINSLRNWRLSDSPWKEGDDEALKDPAVRSKIRARIFFAYTSNQISCGQREVIRYLVQHKLVDVIVTTAGGIEEDIIKCFEPTYMGDFKLSGKELRKKGINRIGNLLVPNKNYCRFEDWVAPLIDKMHDEQDAKWKEMAMQMANHKEGEEEPTYAPFSITPSEFIARLGKEIDNEESVLYWAYKNGIPIFCPALTDGSVGDMIFFHSYKRPGLVVDIARDIRRINALAVQSHCTGQIIIGGGLVKHHTCNANLMRNGADYSVYINTGHEFDGSDGGASPDEAISWGKIRITADPVKVCADATIVFPLIVSQTFAKDLDSFKERNEGCVCWLDGV